MQLGLPFQAPRDSLFPRFQHIQETVVTCSALISTCETAGRWLEALEILRCLPESRVSANSFACNAAISACGKRGCWVHALWLLFEMKLAAWQLDLVSYNAAISACSVSSQWALAWSLVAEMLKLNLQRDAPRPAFQPVVLFVGNSHAWAQVTTYEAALDGLEKGRCSLEAIVLLNHLESHYLED